MSSLSHVVVVLFLIGLAIRSSQATHYADEKSLRTAVLTGYEYKIRPDTTVTCNIRLSLLNINILDVTGQRLSVAGWLTIIWTDSRLVWTPATYGNIADFYDTELVLWRPELIVDNEIANLDILQSDKLLIRAVSDGQMTWEPPGIFETHCDVDITFYPFDTQLCTVEITSWGYTVNEVDLEARDDAIYLANFEESGEWEILESHSERHLLQDGHEYHSQIDFQMTLRRRPSYYVMTILIPVIVTSILCILVFLLPADSGEKVGYTLTILLTYVVMLTLVAGYMPPTSKSTSLLSTYITIVLFVGVFATLATVLTLFLYHRDDKEPIPTWVLKVWTNVLLPISYWKPSGFAGSASGNGDPETLNVFVSSPHKDINKVYPTPRLVTPSNDSKSHPTMVRSQDQMLESKPLTWRDMSLIMDSALFKIMTIFVSILTMVLLLALIIGGYS